MEIKKSINKIIFVLNLQDFKKMNIDIHNILTNCDIKTFLEKHCSKYIKEKYFTFNLLIFQNNICILNFDIEDKRNTEKIIRTYKIIHHTYVNSKIKKDKLIFKSFYDYLNHSIYSKYVSIKNGIIFIKDKSKEKYILNYLSEYE